MNRDILGQIILDFQKDKLPDLIERELQVNLELPLKRATVILGPRRSGKTYYLYSLVKKLLNRGISKERILYVNFEDPKLVAMELSDLSALLAVFYEIYPNNKNRKVWLFFDEIQNIDNWESFVRGILDKEQAYVFLSGSSSKLLSTEIATCLRGRTLSNLILPFSFGEFLKQRKISFSKYLSSEGKAKIANALRDYFSFGGYPEVAIYSQEREKIIREIIEVTIHRDLAERHKIRNLKVIKLMFNSLVEAKEFSLHKFFNFLKSLGLKVSKNSLYNYLDFFAEAFIFFPLRKFSLSFYSSEQSIPKIYCLDNALIESIAGDNKAKKLENLVFLSLVRKNLETNKNIFYYPLGSGEVDFLVREKKQNSLLIQACYDIANYQTKEREMSSLVKAGSELRCKNLIIVTYDREGEERLKGRKIRFIPLWKWLLAEKEDLVI